MSHDPRLKDIADRVLWLEDGVFRAVSEMDTDPVCGMAVEREGSPHYRTEGSTYFFCSTACRDEFVADPGKFHTTPGTATQHKPAPGHTSPASGLHTPFTPIADPSNREAGK